MSFFTAAAALGLLVPRALTPYIAVAVAAGAVALELTGRIPGPRRQVNEDWLHRYRGWVYGAGFGFQLGTGVMTIVTTAAVYLALALTALAHDLAAGLVVGSVYGIARSLPLLLARHVDRPERLAPLHARLGRLARPVRLTTTAGVVVLALVAGVA